MIADERRSLAPAPVLVAFAFGLGALLALVLPGASPYVGVAEASRPDAYSLAYLHVLVRADPGDGALRQLYVQQLRGLGRLDEALAALDEGHLTAAEPQSLRLDLLLQIARALPEGGAARARAFDAVKGQLAVVAGLDLTGDRFQSFAELALELEDPRLAATLYWRAADQRCPERASLLALAGQWMRAAGDEGRAARAYALAASAERDASQAAADELLALRSLEGADRVCDAADLAVAYAARRPADIELLSRATDLASGCGRSYAARDLGRRMVALGPPPLALVERQMWLELGAGDVEAALPLVRALVRERPADVELRTLEAHVAEWSNHPDLALSDWLALLERRDLSAAVRGPR